MSEIVDNWEEISRSSGIITAPAAGSDLLVVETDYGGRLETLEFAATEANFFKLVIRDKGTGANPVTKKVFRLYADGQFVDKETFENPIITWGADKEIAFLNVDAANAGERYSVNMKLWTPRV